jgi:molybdopterin molybdotransferase
MSDPNFVDVRMKGFRQRAEVDDVLTLLSARVTQLPGEAVPLLEAAGRVLAEAVISPVNVPAFPRSAMDGFAVCAADTECATPEAPRTLALIGESLPAKPFAGEVKPGHAVRIMTGAPVPSGADAVLMAEFASAEGSEVKARASVAPGKHIIRVGEDVAKGRAVLPLGRKLRPQDVGLLASIGAASVKAVRRPRVAILVTGNALLPPGAPLDGFKIVDSNSPMLAALAARDRADVLPVQYVPDDYSAVRDAIRAAAASADVILMSGGTSVGTEDHAARAAAELGDLAVHGVAVRPAGPMGVAFLKSGGEGEKGRKGDKNQEETPGGSVPPAHPFTPSPLHPFFSEPLLFLIPGNPVACLCAYDLFAGRAVRRLGGRSWELPYRSETLPLAGAITSAPGRVDYVRVKLESGAARPLASGGASNLSTTVEADGFLLVPRDRAELAPGELVDAWLYDA